MSVWGANKPVLTVGLLQKSADVPDVLPLGHCSDAPTILRAELEAGVEVRGSVSRNSLSFCQTVASGLEERVSVT